MKFLNVFDRQEMLEKVRLKHFLWSMIEELYKLADHFSKYSWVRWKNIKIWGIFNT